MDKDLEVLTVKDIDVNQAINVIQKDIEGLIVGEIAKIKTNEEFVNLDAVGKNIKKFIKIAKDKRLGFTRPLEAKKKEIIARFDAPVGQLEGVHVKVKSACSEWIKEQEAIQAEKDRKAEERARKERERIEEQARKQREKEDSLRLEAERKLKEAEVEKDDKKRKQLEKEALKASKKADTASDRADLKESIASTVVAPISAPINRHGNYTVKTYSVEVLNKRAFIEWCLSTGMLEYLTINESLLNKEATATKGERSWNGIRTIKGESPRSR